MKKIQLLALITVLFCISLATGQQEDEKLMFPVSVGAYANLNINMHAPNFRIPDKMRTGNQGILFDENNYSLGGSFGLLGNYQITDLFVISGRLGYNGCGTIFERKHDSRAGSILPRLDTAVTHKLDASLGYLEISPILQIHNLIPNLRNLYFLAGLEFGYPIVKSYKQTEIIEGNVTFPGGSNERTHADASIPDAQIRLAAALGVGYVLKLTENIFLSPEASFRMPFINVSSNSQFTSWQVPQFRIGASITFGLTELVSKPKPEEPVKDFKVGFKEVRYYNNEGKNFPLQSIRVEDVQYTELFPFIPYVFCEQTLPEPSENNQYLTFKSERGEFTIKKLEPDAVKINKSTLDIIGTRMKENPAAELTITGTNDNKKEVKNTKLSLQRAEWAKKYLVDNHQINPERINIRATNLPDKPSASTVTEGVEENRRIEFSSSSPKLFEPIIIDNENQRLADPNLIEFILYSETEDSITVWNMEISQADKLLRKNTGTGSLPPLQWVIHPNELVNKQIPVDYILTAETNTGKKAEAKGTIPVEYYSTSRKKTEELPDRTISKFSLILFDFDKAEISSADMEIIDKYIVPAIKFNSTVKIYGYTDKIGDETYNLNLSQRRAEAVQAELQKRIKSAKFEVIGVGENNILFDNESPVGRHLSRTVQVHVITPR